MERIISKGILQSAKSGGSEAAHVDCESGFGLIEVLVALTILIVVASAVGMLIVSSLSTAELAKQDTAASSVIEQLDSNFQSKVPTQTCSSANAYAPSVGTGFTVPVVTDLPTLSVTTTSTIGTGSMSHLLIVNISLSWKSAASPTQTATLQSQVMVQCM